MTDTGRLRWDELPTQVRSAIEERLGGSVVTASTQTGGFTPGVAARLTLDSGRVLFLKATSNSLGQADSYRAEARITAALPTDVAAPRLELDYDDGEWVALGFEFIAGRQPALPWVEEDLALVIPALDALAEQLTPSPVQNLPTVADVLGPRCTTWRTLGQRDIAVPHAWARAHVPLLAELEGACLSATEGASMLHLDLRADNLLIRDDGAVFAVDWSWPCIGAAWVDAAGFPISVAHEGRHDPEQLLARSSVGRSAPPEGVNALLAALAGYWVAASQEPEPAHGPGLRAQQAANANVTLDWLARRLGDGSGEGRQIAPRVDHQLGHRRAEGPSPRPRSRP